MANDEDRFPRRLSAVLLADMKDYSALMGEDEAHAIAGVDEVGAVFERAVPRHGGTFEITSGDRFFAIFDSAVEALHAAIEIQRDLATARTPAGRPLAIRIGMHLGEVVRTPFGLMGDSINVAARLQAIAAPGGISVSDDVYRAVRNRAPGVAFRDLGNQTLKNIRDPVRVWAVVPEDEMAGEDAVRAAPSGRWIGYPPIGRRARLVLGATAAAGGTAWLVFRRAPGSPEPSIHAPTKPLVLGVMAVRSRGQVPDWMNDFTRDGLNTVLSKQPDLLVYSKQKIDFLCEKRGLKEIEAAEQLGISKMITASLSAVDATLALEVQIVDIKSGLLEASLEARGTEKQLLEMQNEAAIDVMRSLKLPVNVAEVTKILAKRTNDRLEDYKLLTESMGGEIAEELGVGLRHRHRPGAEDDPDPRHGPVPPPVVALLPRCEPAVRAHPRAPCRR